MMNFSEKRAITKGKLLRNPHLSLIRLGTKSLLLALHDSIGLKMFANTDERYILVIAVEEGTVNVAVDTVNFMEFQLLNSIMKT
jgi:hypothetical protein